MYRQDAAPDGKARPAPQAAPFARPLFFLALATIVALSLAPGEARPHTGFPGPAEHFAAYAGAGVLLAFSYVVTRERLLGLLALAAASGVFELLQQFSPGRHPSVFDALASTSGALFGAAAGAALFAIIAPKFFALDHAAIGRNRPIAENVIDSKSVERAYCEKPASTFSQRALEARREN